MVGKSSRPEIQNFDDSEDDLFAYKAQRWLWNEDSQLRARYVHFDLANLIKVAEDATGEGAVARTVSKLPEGNFNKALLVTMCDGAEVVVKVPNPNAGRSHYTTASEVATMDYVRDNLQIPAPKVLAYCSQVDYSKTGSEYIVMEKASGVELSRVWETMPGRNKVRIVKQLASITSRLANTHFGQFGSIYRRGDVSSLQGTGKDEDFVIGPTTARSWFDNRRGQINIGRGPWSSSLEYFNAVVQRESACLETLPLPHGDCQQGIYNGLGGYHPTKEAKTSVLRDFLKIVAHILPKDEALNSGVMWHSDLHSGNIFVDEAENATITSIIDWQAVPVYPMFLHADYPGLIDFEGEKPEIFEESHLPENINDLGPVEQKAAKALLISRSLWTLYEIDSQRACPALIHTFRHRNTLLGHLLGIIGSLSDDAEPFLQSLLVDLSQESVWKQVVGVDDSGNAKAPCPLRYSEDEIKRQKAEFAKWERDIERKAQVVEELGAYTGWDGAVLPEQYDDMVARLERAKQRFLDREAKTLEERNTWEKAWPFRDSTM